MKIIFLVFCMSAFLAHIYGHISPVAESFKACLVENEMSRDDFIQALQSNNDTVNTKAQCIAACTMEKEKFINEENINIDAIIAKMEDVTQEIGKSQVTNLVQTCKSEAEDTAVGKCGVAHSVVRCIHDELRKEGWI